MEYACALIPEVGTCAGPGRTGDLLSDLETQAKGTRFGQCPALMTDYASGREDLGLDLES